MSVKFPNEEFNLREAKGEDFYRIMIVNTALEGYQFKRDFPWSLVFDVDIKDITQEYKLPTESEAIILNLLEDTLIEIIKGNCSCQYVGRITDNGHRYLYFHIDAPELIHDALQKFIASELNSHEFSYEMTKDEEWRTTNIFFK